MTVEQTRPRRNRGRDGLIALAVLLALAIGIATGYFLWGRQPDWFAGHDPNTLPPGAGNDLIRFGRELVVNTAMHIGPSAASPEARFAGNISPAPIVTSMPASSPLRRRSCRPLPVIRWWSTTGT